MRVRVAFSAHRPDRKAGIAQLVERNLAKVEVASSNLVARSNFPFPGSRPRGGVV